MTARTNLPENEAAFTSVLEANKDRIYRLCRCYVGDRDAANDVFQDALVHVWKSLGSFEGRSQVSTWVYRVTVNTCLAHLRSEKRRLKMFGDAGSEPAEVADENTDSDTMDDIERLYECINQLPPTERALVSLYLEDVCMREMAEILGISEANVRVKVHRVKKSLKEIWERRNHGSR